MKSNGSVKFNPNGPGRMLTNNNIKDASWTMLLFAKISAEWCAFYIGIKYTMEQNKMSGNIGLPASA